MEKRIEELQMMFEYTDFTGDIGTHVLVMKSDGYDTEETLRNKLTDSLSSLKSEIIKRVEKESESWCSCKDDGARKKYEEM